MSDWFTEMGGTWKPYCSQLQLHASGPVSSLDGTNIAEHQSKDRFRNDYDLATLKYLYLFLIKNIFIIIFIYSTLSYMVFY